MLPSTCNLHHIALKIGGKLSLAHLKYCQARFQVQGLSQISNKRPGPGACSYKGSLQKKKNKNKKCGFFPHWGGSTPNPHFYKSLDFQGGVWGLGSNFHTFLDIFYFF